MACTEQCPVEKKNNFLFTWWKIFIRISSSVHSVGLHDKVTQENTATDWWWRRFRVKRIWRSCSEDSATAL